VGGMCEERRVPGGPRLRLGMLDPFLMSRRERRPRALRPPSQSPVHGLLDSAQYAMPAPVPPYPGPPKGLVQMSVRGQPDV
jgi:hypothetical protein